MTSPRRWLATASLVLLFGRHAGAVGVITTVAGGGTGDGQPGNRVGLDPLAVTHDAAGNILLTVGLREPGRVWRIDAATRVATIVAGGEGVCGPDLGDGGPATAACLSSPRGIAVDPDGNVFIADTGHDRVRRVDTVSGQMSTVVSGLVGVLDVVVDAARNVFASARGEVVRIGAGSGTVTPLAPGWFTVPGGLGLDGGGNLFVADLGAQRIYRIAASDGTVTTVAGSGTRGFCGDGDLAAAACFDTPIDVAVDGGGNLYVADRYNYRVRRIDASSGQVSTVAGTGQPLYACAPDFGDGGPATAGCLGEPLSVAVNTAGDVLIADPYTFRVRRVSAGVITAAAGTGEDRFCGDGDAATSACLDQPYGISRDAAGNLFVSDSYNNRIRRVDVATGIITTVAGAAHGPLACGPDVGDGGPATEACLVVPTNTALDLAGNLYIADGQNNRVRRVDVATGIITTVAGSGETGFCGDGGPATEACFGAVAGLAVDVAGNLYVADRFDSRVRRVEAGSSRIETIAGNGDYDSCGDGGPATAACLRNPSDIALDGGGNLYILDPASRRVRRVDATTGRIATVAGGGTAPCVEGGPATNDCFFAPGGLAADLLGNVFVADLTRIYRVDHATGMISAVAGSGAPGFCGDGGTATLACLVATALTVDPDGTLMIADTANDRIRRVTCDGPDSDGDGRCDEYDFTDLAGLDLQSVVVEETGSGPSRRRGKWRLKGEIATSMFSATGDPAAFFAQARLTGFSARLLSPAAPPRISQLALIDLGPADCRFIPSQAAVPQAVRCKQRGAARVTLTLRQLSSARFTLGGLVRDPRLRVPPGGPLRVVFSVKDAGALDYDATAGVCALETSGRRALSCTSRP